MSAGTRWIVAIVVLLGGNMVAMGVLLGASRLGAPQVIPAYYEKAVRYNDAIDQAARNRALGWRVTARWAGEVVADVVDREGVPLVGATVQIATLARTATQRRGLHDVTVTVTRGPDVFVETSVVEVR